MFIFNGKFDWSNNALNETITFVFPAGFALNDPVSAYWQWSVDAEGNSKSNVTQVSYTVPTNLQTKLMKRPSPGGQSGIIGGVTKGANDYTVHVSYDHYSFDVALAADSKSIDIIMRNPSGEHAGPFKLSAVRIDAARVPSTVVYTGKLNWLSYAKDEMITLVVPGGVSEGAFFGLYHQWTVDAGGNKKANHAVNGAFQDVKADLAGHVTATFRASYYTYDFIFDGQRGSLTLSNPSGHKSEGNTFVQTDFRSLGVKKVRTCCTSGYV